LNFISAHYRKILLGIFLLIPAILHAQTNEQVWGEYMLNYPFANSWNVEFAGTYSTVMGEPKWRGLDLQVTPGYSITQHIDVMGALYVGDVFQNQSLSTFEVREMVGARVHFTPNKRLLTRVLIRYEQRNLKNQQEDTWQHVVRPRVRLETVFPINKKSMHAGDQLWYTIFYGEWFFNDKDVDERFANRFRLSTGLGYRINYNFRIEFMYTLQESRNTAEDNFYTADHIFRFRLKQYLRKDNPTSASGVGS